ncbi:MAG: hypothetical protein ABR600_12695 [Actinomycetota bacterium]
MARLTCMRARALVVLVALLLGACAKASDRGAGDGSPTPPYPAGPNDLVLRVDSCCGFVAYEYTLRQLPSFTLTGDGRIMTLGPQIEIYPGPALPNVQEQPVTDEGIRAILAEAQKAGLDESHDYIAQRTISDAPTTIFTLVDADGTQHVTRVYALDEADDKGSPAPEQEARKRLRHLQERLGDLASWLPPGSLGDQREYRMDALRISVRDYNPQEADPKQSPQDWPLDAPLATFGDPVEGQAGMRCGVVSGDLQMLLPEVKRSNELTPWTSESKDYRLFLRPLLPDEHGCATPGP